MVISLIHLCINITDANADFLTYFVTSHQIDRVLNLVTSTLNKFVSFTGANE